MTYSLPLTRSEAIVRHLREEIVSGRLAPGTVVKDAELAESLGVSITPVREAIAQLAAEGLIDLSPNRTRRVTARVCCSGAKLGMYADQPGPPPPAVTR